MSAAQVVRVTSTSSGHGVWRTVAAGFAVLALALAGCGEIETESEDSYEPATVETADPSAPPTVKLTEEAAGRIDLAFATVNRIDGDVVVDYAALIYDKKGKTWVYTVQEPLTFIRTAVKVDDIDGDQVTLSEGPPVGTKIVTRGVTQVYGAELGMEGSH